MSEQKHQDASGDLGVMKCEDPKEGLMSKKIYIVERKGSFSDEWLKYCETEGISYELVDPYRSDLIAKIRDGAAFLWHWRHDSYKDQIFARQLFSALESSSILTYPNIQTCWHFDDKLAQKYLFEITDLPAAPAHVFYDAETARAWLRTCTYPVVFKLRGGAGALNVRLANTRSQAERLVKKAFSSGFAYFERWEIFKQSIWRARRDKSFRSIVAVFYHLSRSLLPIFRDKADLHPREVGYVYFQEFIPRNTFDDRLVVVGDCCFAVRRYCREGDFRASGSGLKNYDPALFPNASILLAFKIADTLRMQSVAIDLVYREDESPVVVEVSYGFVTAIYPGFFDRDGVWHSGDVSAPTKVIESLLKNKG